LNPNKLVIVLRSSVEDYVYLTWDLIKNQEITNFSAEGNYYFINGLNSETGYILNQTRYINMDKGIPNYYFDTEFNYCYILNR
jgi:hypothetical protein